MKSDQSVTVNYANLTYAFMKFQEQYKNLCQTISTNKRREISKSLKNANTFYYEYRTYISSRELGGQFDRYLVKVKDNIYDDKEFTKLCAETRKSVDENIAFNQKYYNYLIKVLKVVGKFGDELSRTFMPNKTDREKLFKYWNNNSFFEQFTYYKSKVAESLSDFSIRKFKEGFAFFLGFYFAYYLFIDEKSRHLCENVLGNILNIVLNVEVLKIIETPSNKLNSVEKETLRKIDYEVHNALNHVFSKCNDSFSEYGIMPRKERKLLIDKTAI